MWQFSLPFLLGIGFSLALTPVSRRVAIRIGAIDNPGARRIHAVATPRLGGPAILFALAMAMVLVPHGSQAPRLSWLAIGALMVTGIGTIDDVRPLRPIIKLLVEVAAASVAAYGGYRIDSMVGYQLGLVSFPLSVLLVVAVVNAVNLVDGLDGLATGLCLIIGATLLLMGFSRAAIETSMTLAALCGVLLGFLAYNFHPAQIFLGDSGALLLGFMLAASAISTSRQMTGSVAKLAPFLALGMPLAELTLTTLRRLLRAVQVVRDDEAGARYRFCLVARPALFAADRDHVHHRLLAMGLGDRKVALLLYTVSAAICAAAFAIAIGVGSPLPLLIAALAGGIVGIRFLGYGELMPLRTGLLLPMLESFARGHRAMRVTAAAMLAIVAWALHLGLRVSIFEAGFLAAMVLGSRRACRALEHVYQRNRRYQPSGLKVARLEIHGPIAIADNAPESATIMPIRSAGVLQ